MLEALAFGAVGSLCFGAVIIGMIKLLGRGAAPRGPLTDSGKLATHNPAVETSTTPARLRGGERFEGIDIAGGRGFWFDVVGESNYQGTLRGADNGRLETGADVVMTCLVVPEPENKYDTNALAVHIHDHGRVGYFQRDESSGRYRALGDRLRREGKVGVCEGKLTGGWDEDISIGIRLSIMTPSELEAGTVSPRKDEEPERLELDMKDWTTRQLIVLDAGKRYGLNLVDERLCQAELKRLAAGRDPVKDSMGFEAVLVPDGEAVVVCAVGGQPVGRLSKSDVGRYSVVRDHLVRSGMAAVCKAWIITERDGLGVRLSLRGPAALEKALGLLRTESTG